MSVILETSLGDITVDLYKELRPRACLNFIKLCKINYYNYSTLISVQRDFTIQMGDPTGTGRGGESVFWFVALAPSPSLNTLPCVCSALYGEQAKYFEAETVPKLKHRKIGTLSMVNNGENMHGSQFFITTGENLAYLDGVHTVFGEVAEGFDVLTEINETICDDQHRPYKDLRLNHTIILDDPFEDPPGLRVPAASPEPTDQQLETERIGVDEEVDETKGKTMEEIEEEIQEKEAKARAIVLEMVGDLPDAEVKPPENVLFVCKLNPVTTDEDLNVIFSRFGPIVSCEIIRDKKNNESLQYAFIEFKNEEDCVHAYFKMDNVLIDDRRIHVDFSQSVARLKYEAAKKGDKRGKPKWELKKSAQSRGTGEYKMVFDQDGDRSPEPKKSSKHSALSQKRKRGASSHSPSSDTDNRGQNRRDNHHRSPPHQPRRGEDTPPSSCYTNSSWVRCDIRNSLSYWTLGELK